jgi:predicted O-methyltransferase YrrM
LFHDAAAHPALLRLAHQSRELADIVVKTGERYLDPLRARKRAYPAIEWTEQCDAIEGATGIAAGGIRTALEEAALARFERAIRARRAELIERGPWGGHYDADLTLGRCLYALCRALRPSLVVETGVAYGLSSAFILLVLHTNEHGELHSIELPPPAAARKTQAEYIGALIPDRLTHRWRLHLGASRRLLPAVMGDRTLDLFLHDSSHTYRNMRREYTLAWRHLRPGGMLVSDDVECSQAFGELRGRDSAFWAACRQQGKRALFGIAVK